MFYDLALQLLNLVTVADDVIQGVFGLKILPKLSPDADDFCLKKVDLFVQFAELLNIAEQNLGDDSINLSSFFYRNAIDDQFLAFPKIDHAEFGDSSLGDNRNPGVRKDFRYVFPHSPFGAQIESF